MSFDPCLLPFCGDQSIPVLSLGCPAPRSLAVAVGSAWPIGPDGLEDEQARAGMAGQSPLSESRRINGLALEFGPDGPDGLEKVACTRGLTFHRVGVKFVPRKGSNLRPFKPSSPKINGKPLNINIRAYHRSGFLRPISKRFQACQAQTAMRWSQKRGFSGMAGGGLELWLFGGDRRGEASATFARNRLFSFIHR